MFQRLAGLNEAMDGDELAGHRRGRDKRAAMTAVASLLARLIAMAVALLTIPLMIGVVGTERYGLFATLTSIASMLIFADLGLSNGTLNLLSEAHGHDDKKAASVVSSSAIAMLTVVTLVLGLALLAAFTWLPWEEMLNLSESVPRTEARAVAAIVLGMFVVALPLGLGQRVRLAYQEGYIHFAFAAVAAIASLIGVAAAAALEADFPVFAAAIAIPPVVALAFNAYLILGRSRPWLRPRLEFVDRQMAIRLMRLGGMFVALQLAVAIAFQSDVVVASIVLGPHEAAVYAVTLKVAMVVPSLATMYATALWPAYAEALARGDFTWVRRTLRRSIVFAAGASAIASGVLLLGGGWLIRWWTAGEVNPPPLLLFGAATWAVLFSTFTTIAVLLNAASIIRFQVVVAVVMAVGSVALSALLAHALGVAGIVWGTVVAYVVLAAIPIGTYLPKVLDRLEHDSLRQAP